MTALDSDECWAVLRSQEFGRMAYHDGESVSLVPINYAVDEQRRLVFRTAEGEKLLAVKDNDDIAFEVDEITESTATSIILRGRAHELTGAEAAWVDTTRLRPWVPTSKVHVIAIDPFEVSGRTFQLARPWLHMVPDHPIAPRTRRSRAS
ncbi:MAG TPA: pyridoxamine 5'-phosphate oxidase family protein [Candidatus Lustribacter sp.]|nr:pyridoxamine 5'-phosphate oxidase family protein [Candidatus Lustribacter sp.]